MRASAGANSVISPLPRRKLKQSPLTGFLRHNYKSSPGHRKLSDSWELDGASWMDFVPGDIRHPWLARASNIKLCGQGGVRFFSPGYGFLLAVRLLSLSLSFQDSEIVQALHWTYRMLQEGALGPLPILIISLDSQESRNHRKCDSWPQRDMERKMWGRAEVGL